MKVAESVGRQQWRAPATTWKGIYPVGKHSAIGGILAPLTGIATIRKGAAPAADGAYRYVSAITARTWKLS